MDILSGRYSLSYDPVTGKIILLGSSSMTGQIAGAVYVYTIDPTTMKVQYFGTTGPGVLYGLLPESVGTYMDSEGRTLYVSGSRLSDNQLAMSYVWKLDLRTRQWSLLSAASLVESPEGLATPFVYYNRLTSTLWVGDLTGGLTSDGLRLWALDAQGDWHPDMAFRLPGAVTFPVHGVYSGGVGQSYAWTVAESIDWPGDLVLARLMASEPVLGLSVVSSGGGLLGQGELASDGSDEAGFLCPVGERCYLNVSARGPAAWVSYDLDVVPAQRVPEGGARLSGQAVGLEVWGERLYVASTGGLQVYTLGGVQQLLGKLSGQGVAGINAIAHCGAHLCLARHGSQGLEVLDISKSTQLAVVGRAATQGGGLDLAVLGLTAYVAQGEQGVGIFDVSAPGTPSNLGQLSPGGRAVTVAAQGTLLAVGLDAGAVALYDRRSGQVSGRLSAKGKIARIRFVAGQLWVSGKQGDWVEVYDVTEPGSPLKLATLDQKATPYLEGRFRGPRFYSLQGNRLATSVMVPR